MSHSKNPLGNNLVVSPKEKSLDHKGFTLLEVLVSMALLGVVALGAAAISSELSKILGKANKTAGLRAALQQIELGLTSTAGWGATVSDPINSARLACLQPGSTLDCFTRIDPLPDPSIPNPPDPRPFNRVYGPSGNSAVWQRIDNGGQPAINGLTWDGQPCRSATFSPTPACPISVKINIYRIGCSQSPCPQTDVLIRSRLDSINPPYAINLNNYRFEIIKKGTFDISRLCTQFNGTWDPQAELCTYSSTTPCNGNVAGAGSYLIGLDANFQPICGSDACGPGTYSPGNRTLPDGRSVPDCQPISAAFQALTCAQGKPLLGLRRNPAGVTNNPEGNQRLGLVSPICSTSELIDITSNCPAGESPTGIVRTGDQWQVTGCTKYQKDRPGDNGCTLPGSYIKKLNDDGTYECAFAAKPAQNCNSGEYVTGIDQFGGVNCSPFTLDWPTVASHMNIQCVTQFGVAPLGSTSVVVTCPSSHPNRTGGGVYCHNSSQPQRPWASGSAYPGFDRLPVGSPPSTHLGTDSWQADCGGGIFDVERTYGFAVCCRIGAQ